MSSSPASATQRQEDDAESEPTYEYRYKTSAAPSREASDDEAERPSRVAATDNGNESDEEDSMFSYTVAGYLPEYGHVSKEDDQWIEVTHPDAVLTTPLTADFNQSVYRLDVESDPKAATLQQNALNKGLTLTMLYGENGLKARRFHTKFPGHLLPLAHVDDVRTTVSQFEPLLSSGANHTHMFDYANGNLGVIAMLQEPGSMFSVSDSVDFRKTALVHSIPLVITCESAHNTTACRLALKVQTPNSGMGNSLWKDLATPVGVDSMRCHSHISVETTNGQRREYGDVTPESDTRGKLYTSIPPFTVQASKPLHSVMYTAPEMLQEPEFRRWSCVNVAAVKKTFRDANVFCKKTMECEQNGTDFDIIFVPLRADPQNWAEFLCASYSHALILASQKLCVSDPEIVDGSVAGADYVRNGWTKQYLHISIAALDTVLEAYAAHFSPGKYGANHGQWQIAAIPNDLVGMLVHTATTGSRAVAQASATLRIVHIPFPSPEQIRANKHYPRMRSDMRVCIHEYVQHLAKPHSKLTAGVAQLLSQSADVLIARGRELSASAASSNWRSPDNRAKVELMQPGETAGRYIFAKDAAARDRHVHPASWEPAKPGAIARGAAAASAAASKPSGYIKSHPKPAAKEW